MIASFVEELRASRWTHACFHRPSARVRVTVPRGEKVREHVLPDPVAPEAIDALRRPTAPQAVDDELRIVFGVFWSRDCVPQHVLAEVEEDDEDEDNEDSDEELLHERRILQVESEHPRYYQVEILVARDLVGTWGNNVTYDFETRCACGELLSYERPDDRWPAIGQPHVRAVCAKCARQYDPAADTPTGVVVDSGYERAPADVNATPRDHTRLLSHLSVVLDFEKDWPVLPAGEYLTVDPAFVLLCESVFGQPFEVVNVFI